jgi:hypothetical protein
MMAHDSLPERIRLLLNYSAAKHSAVECARMLDRVGEDDLYQMILRTDAVMVWGQNV